MYNGVSFDLPFMQRALAIPIDTVTAWVLKTSDILEQLHLRDNATCKLDYLCAFNDVPTKSSCGHNAKHLRHTKDKSNGLSTDIKGGRFTG